MVLSFAPIMLPRAHVMFLVLGFRVPSALLLLALCATSSPALGDDERQSLEHGRSAEYERERDPEPGRVGADEAPPDAESYGSRLPIPTIDAREVSPGERVLVRWRPIDPKVEEFELILSLDDGREWILRISPELEVEDSRHVWEVPNLAADKARVRIRARIDGRETWGPPSRAFRIAADSNRPPEPWLFWESAGRAIEAGDSRAAAGLAARAPEPVLRAGEPVSPVGPPVRALPPSRPLGSFSLPIARPHVPVARAEGLATLHARFRPLRE
jgi:hypothetical protein